MKHAPRPVSHRLIAAVIALAGLVALHPAAPAATNLRGMETGEDFRFGPVLSTGLPLGLAEPGDRQYYQLSLQGESPNHGFSRIFLRVISLYELLNILKLNDSSGAVERQVRFHHQFASFGLESPLFYELSSPTQFEFGWSAALSLARVTFKEPVKPAATGITSVFSDYPELAPSALGAQVKANQAQQDAQFIGSELGGYLRYYGLYPLVPYFRGGINLGSYFDANSMVKGSVPQPEPSASAATSTGNTRQTAPQRLYKSAFVFSPIASVGLDFYLASRGLLGVEFSFWNWDILNRPQDTTFFLNLKAGFLF